MDYKIISFDEASGSVVIRYREDASPISVNLPLDENGLYVTGEALDQYIRGFIPVEYFQRIDTIKAGVQNADAIKALVQPEPVQEITQETVITSAEEKAVAEGWEKYEFEKQVGAALVKFGLVSSNPAQIPVFEG
jgi:DNA polymerase III sliding clamp (beta) subunit (PCNA family)